MIKSHDIKVIYRIELLGKYHFLHGISTSTFITSLEKVCTE